MAIRDITGKSGLAIMEAILAGNRDPNYLASLVDVRMKKSQEEIAQSLHGSWRQVLLFELQASLDFYKHYQNALLACDGVIEQALRRSVPVESVSKPVEKKLSKHEKKPSKHTPAFDLSNLANQYFQTDLFAISGISYNTVLCLLTTLEYVLDRIKKRIGRILKSPDYQEHERNCPRTDRFSVETY
jgi:hypothetical protein